MRFVKEHAEPQNQRLISTRQRTITVRIQGRAVEDLYGVENLGSVDSILSFRQVLSFYGRESSYGTGPLGRFKLGRLLVSL